MHPEWLPGYLSKCHAIVIVVGAGISTSSGIPDFRSDSGLYRLLENCNEKWRAYVNEPQEIFDIRTFLEDPRIFYAVASTLYVSFCDAKPSLCHAFLAALSSRALRVITQNVDCLEEKAGVAESKLEQIHGSLREAVCSACGHRVDLATCASVKSAIISRGLSLPACDSTRGPCAVLEAKPVGVDRGEEGDDEGDRRRKRKRGHAARTQRWKGVFKPAVVFFHEPLPEGIEAQAASDLLSADCVLFIGSSLRVSPVSNFPFAVKEGVPRVLINNEPLPHLWKSRTLASSASHSLRPFDLELIGDADSIIAWLWEAMRSTGGTEGEGMPPVPPCVVSDSHVTSDASGTASFTPVPVAAAAAVGAGARFIYTGPSVHLLHANSSSTSSSTDTDTGVGAGSAPPSEVMAALCDPLATFAESLRMSHPSTNSDRPSNQSAGAEARAVTVTRSGRRVRHRDYDGAEEPVGVGRECVEGPWWGEAAQ